MTGAVIKERKARLRNLLRSKCETAEWVALDRKTQALVKAAEKLEALRKAGGAQLTLPFIRERAP